MPKHKALLWITIFIIIIASPSCTYFFLGKYVDSENYENRNSTSKPTLTSENYELFPKEYDAYFNDNIPFRNQLIRLNSSIDYFLFHQSPNKNVVIGKDGWLFYCDNTDANPVEQSLGYWHFTEEQLHNIAENLTSIQKALNSHGIEFVLFIAPNKETIYKEYLPDYYNIKNLYTSTDQLVDYLHEQTTIRVIYPKKELLTTKEEQTNIILYHKLDTHWNSAGAYIGAKCLAKELGIDMPSINTISLQTKQLSSGDLSNMLHTQINNGSIDYDITGISAMNTENEKWDFLTEFIYHTSGADPRRLFVYRDSYASAMASSLATQFSDSLWVYKDNFNWQQVLDYDANIFVLETVERYETDLIQFNIDDTLFSELDQNIQGFQFTENTQIPIDDTNEYYRALVKNGFYDVENSENQPNVWTSGDSSLLAVNFEPGYTKDFRLVIDILTTVGGSPQSIIVYANDQKLDNISMSQNSIYIDVPNDLIRNDLLLIKLCYPDAYIPSEKGESTDPRKLAFLINGIHCEEYEIK